MRVCGLARFLGGCVSHEGDTESTSAVCTDGGLARAALGWLCITGRCDNLCCGALFALVQRQRLRVSPEMTRNAFLAAEMRQQLGLRAAPNRVNPI